MSKPIYKLVDSKGRVLIPKALRETAHMEYGDIVRIGLSSGRITVTKVDIVEVGDQSSEAVEAYVRAAVKAMPDSKRLELPWGIEQPASEKGGINDACLYARRLRTTEPAGKPDESCACAA